MALMNTAAPLSYRQDFPLLVNQPQLSYLDSAASAQKPQAVLAAMEEAHTQYYANIHRGLYELSAKSTSAYEAARTKIARFIGAPSPDTIVFTRNATEAINLVANSWAGAFLQKGDAVLISELEHHANIVPWQILRDKIGIELQIARIEEDGSLTATAVANAMTDRTKLVALTHMSNALGTLPEVEKIIPLAQQAGAKVLVDGSQAVVHQSVDVQALDADFYVFTGHKLYGPSGIGVLYAKADLLAAMPPYQGGGEMIKEVTFANTTYADAPAKFEAGTPNIVGAIGLGAAVDYLATLDRPAVYAQEQALLSQLTTALQTVPDLTLYGTAAAKASIASFTLAGISAQDIGIILDQCHVAVRVGHHCAQPLMQRLGTPATVRASLGIYNNQADVEALIQGLHTVRKLCG